MPFNATAFLPRKSFVKRNIGMTKASNAAALAQGHIKGAAAISKKVKGSRVLLTGCWPIKLKSIPGTRHKPAQSQSNILDRVVVVDLQVAFAGQLQIEAAMLG